jgi:D-alanine-D-alanine ligase
MLEFSARSDRSLRVLLLAGGPSAEREVSLETGLAVHEALRDRGHRVHLFDPIDGSLDSLDPRDHDVAFLALHGAFGEDGTVQSLLESLDLPYTGSGVEASRTAISKTATKQALRDGNLPTPDWHSIHRDMPRREIEAAAEELGFPQVSKPDREGSSLGVSILKRPDELPAALESCFQFGPRGLLERAVPGTEWTVGLFDRQPLPPLQIVTEGEFYDFEAKYRSDRTEYHFSSAPSLQLLTRLRDLAVKACGLLQTRGIARVDFRLDRDQNPWILEVNTIPGMTSHSLIPKAAARLGISFEELCDQALTSALAAWNTTARRVA